MRAHISHSEQVQLIEKLDIFKIEGKDKCGREILRITGKHFPGRYLSVEALRGYLEEKLFNRLRKHPFSVLYLHAGVERSENSPGISAIRSIYDIIPISVKDNLQAIYFLHPSLQSKLFLGIFGRLLFGAGLYGKMRYIDRIEYLWEHVRRNEVEIPEFVNDHDEDLEYCHMMDYGLESDHPRAYAAAPSMDSPLTTYSTRCIS